jgi:hypothetical protein
MFQRGHEYYTNAKARAKQLDHLDQTPAGKHIRSFGYCVGDRFSGLIHRWLQAGIVGQVAAASNMACQHPIAASLLIGFPYSLYDQSRAASNISLVGFRGILAASVVHCVLSDVPVFVIASSRGV